MNGIVVINLDDGNAIAGRVIRNGPAYITMEDVLCMLSEGRTGIVFMRPWNRFAVFGKTDIAHGSIVSVYEPEERIVTLYEGSIESLRHSVEDYAKAVAAVFDKFLTDPTVH